MPNVTVIALPQGAFSLVAAPGKSATGITIEADDPVSQRLDFWCSGHPTEDPNTGVTQYVSKPTTTATVPWSLTKWQNEHGALIRHAAAEYMRLIQTHSAAEASRAWPQILMRAASHLRAQSDPSPATLTPVMNEAAISHSMRQPYTDYFAVREDDLTFPQFSGGQSAVVKRASFLGGDAVTVLPYDPKADTILIVRQFRHGPFARGDTNPWTLEPAAGRIDPGERPDQTARRELFEETGVKAGDIHFVGRYYPSPGAFSEYLFSYIAVADLSEIDGTIGGLEDEAEDIMAHVVQLDQAMALIEAGEINTGPLILSLQWLALNKSRL